MSKQVEIIERIEALLGELKGSRGRSTQARQSAGNDNQGG